MAKAKRGRAPQGEYAAKTDVMSFRIRPDIKAALRKAAKTSGRSLSQETEHRLRRALDEDRTISSFWGDAKTFAMMQLAAQTVLSLGKVRDTKVHWTANVEAFDAAMEAIIGTLRVFRPLVATSLSTGRPEIGAPASSILREAQAADPTRPLNKSTRRQRAMTRFKEDLGEELVDRAMTQIPRNQLPQAKQQQRREP
jgi:hypothetical protein